MKAVAVFRVAARVASGALISQSPDPPIREAQRPAATQKIVHLFFASSESIAATVLFSLLSSDGARCDVARAMANASKLGGDFQLGRI
jgi:hypothetical protein